MSAEGAAVIGLQMGSNMGATQSGMSMGSQRHAADLQTSGEPRRRSSAFIQLKTN